MKVIGVGAREEMIVLVSKDEIANMVGFYASYGLPDAVKSLNVGTQINMGDYYRRATDALN